MIKNQKSIYQIFYRIYKVCFLQLNDKINSDQSHHKAHDKKCKALLTTAAWKTIVLDQCRNKEIRENEFFFKTRKKTDKNLYSN